MVVSFLNMEALVLIHETNRCSGLTLAVPSLTALPCVQSPAASAQSVRGKHLPEPQQLHFASQGSLRKLPSHVATATGALSHLKSCCREISQVLFMNEALSDVGW